MLEVSHADFLEMLPGCPAWGMAQPWYLVFFDLSKELDEPYDIPFSRDDTIITPYTKRLTQWKPQSLKSSLQLPNECSSCLSRGCPVQNLQIEWEVWSPVVALVGTGQVGESKRENQAGSQNYHSKIHRDLGMSSVKFRIFVFCRGQLRWNRTVWHRPD